MSVKARVVEYTFVHPPELDVLGTENQWLGSLHPSGVGEAGAVKTAEETSGKSADKHVISASHKPLAASKVEASTRRQCDLCSEERSLSQWTK